MGFFSLLRFLTPNTPISVSEGANDLTTTAALGQAVENIDTYATRNNGTNTATSAMTLDLSLIAVNTFKTRVANSAAPTADGALETEAIAHAMKRGRNGSTVTLAELETAQTWTGLQTFGPWDDGAQVTVASAATFPLPTTGNNVNVTGTTGITDFSGPATNGMLYKLQFSNATPGSVTNGNHAKLNGTLTTAQNNILYLYWDGTNAWEIGRYTGSGATLTTIGPTFATSDTTMTNAGTFYTGVTLGSALLAAKTYLLTGAINFNDTGVTGDTMTGTLYDSTNSVAIFEGNVTSSSIAGSLGVTLTIPPTVYTGYSGTPTIILRGESNGAGDKMKATATGTGATANKATFIQAIQIA